MESKLIRLGGNTVTLVEHAIGPAKHGEHRNEAGRDASGKLYWKGKTGRWSRAYQTREAAESLLKTS
jgi:hypothetical protein